MVIENNNPDMIPALLLVVCIGIVLYNIVGIIYSEIRLGKLKHLKGLIIENHKKFKRN